MSLPLFQLFHYHISEAFQVGGAQGKATPRLSLSSVYDRADYVPFIHYSEKRAGERYLDEEQAREQEALEQRRRSKLGWGEGVSRFVSLSLSLLLHCSQTLDAILTILVEDVEIPPSNRFGSSPSSQTRS